VTLENNSGNVAGEQCFFPKFWAVGKISFFVRKLLSKSTKCEAKTSILDRFKNTIKIFSSYNFLCRKFLVVGRNFVENLQIRLLSQSTYLH